MMSTQFSNKVGFSIANLLHNLLPVKGESVNWLTGPHSVGTSMATTAFGPHLRYSAIEACGPLQQFLNYLNVQRREEEVVCQMV